MLRLRLDAGPVLDVIDVEVFTRDSVAYRVPENLDEWVEADTGGGFSVEGDCVLSLHGSGPGDSYARYCGDVILGRSPEAAVLLGGRAVARIAFGSAEHIFVSEVASRRYPTL